MKRFQIRGVVLLLVASLPLLWADDPTSRFVSLSAIPTSLPSSTSGNAVQFEIWNQATGGVQISTEAHTAGKPRTSRRINVIIVSPALSRIQPELARDLVVPDSSIGNRGDDGAGKKRGER